MKFFLLQLAFVLSGAVHNGNHQLGDHGLHNLRAFMKHIKSEYSKPYNFQTEEEIKRADRLREIDSYNIH